ncbi:MAG TPA: hypothetical protein VG692_02145 [Gemmatimonadales bacterium]|nr:hypothetical protein [Gemmatimonadales bacterium]
MDTNIAGEPVVPGQVGLAVRAMIFGTLLGTTLVSLALWGARVLQGGAPQAAVTGGPVFALVVGGTFAGLGMAVGVAWALMRSLRSPFRRGGLSILAGFLTLLAMLPTVVVDRMVGPAGLLGFAALCALACLLLSRRVASGPRAP